MTRRNIYIRSLEIGYESENDGISFNDLKSILKKEGYSYDDTVLRNWYYLNFEYADRHLFIAGYNEIYNKDDNIANPLSSDSFMKYIEYLELKESRESTKKALNFSLAAIIVAIISMILNVISLALVYKENQFQNQQQKTKIDRQMELNIKAIQSYHHNDSLSEIDQLKKQSINQDTLLNKPKAQTE